MRKIVLGACAASLFFALEHDAPSIGKGIFPNTTVVVGSQSYTVGSLTRVASASCGGVAGVCHRSGPFLTRVDVTAGDLILAKNDSTNVSITATNPGVQGLRGGFCADVTLGTLVAGVNTKVDATAKQITHGSFNGRQWSFGFQAGSQTGLVELFAVGNCVNGNGRADGADEWGFRSSKLLAQECTPVRLYVNADGVRSTGPGCVDGNGNQSVLGAPSPPDVGNAGFRVEAYGLPPSSSFLFMLSVGGGVPGFDMAPMGAPGCVLRTALQVQLAGPTSGGDPVRSEGRVIFPAPIPNDATLRGLVLSMQVAAVDPQSARAFPLVVTNGLEVTIR